MTDIRSDVPQDLEHGAPDEHDGRHATDRQTTAEAIQVLVFSPDGTPRLQTIENRPDALEALVGGPSTTLPTGTDGTVGVANAERVGNSPTPDRAIDATGTSICGTFVVMGDAGNGVSLQSISPLQLEQALERFCPTLPLAQFEQIVRSHTLGPEWIANWEPPDS